MFLTNWLFEHSDLIDYLGLNGEMSVSMLLVGNFNCSKEDEEKLTF